MDNQHDRRRRNRAIAAGVVVLTLVAAGCGGGTGGSPQSTPSLSHRVGSAAPSRPASTGDSGSGQQPGRSASSNPTQSTSQTSKIDLHASKATIRSRARHVPVLNYHQIRNWTGTDSAQDKSFILPPARFRSQMRYLARHHYHPISPHQLLAYLTTGTDLPNKPVLLTFDDADKNQITHALPALRKHHFTATLFIMTVVLGNKHYMTTRQIRRLDEGGMTIGGHTWDHHRFDRYTGHDWITQIKKPTNKLEHILGHRIHYFAYPYGAWNPAAFPHLHASGYRAAFQLTDKPVNKTRPLLSLHRTLVNPHWSLHQFATHL